MQRIASCPCNQQRSIRWFDFKCPMTGSTAWRRLSQRSRCSVIDWHLPRSTPLRKACMKRAARDLRPFRRFNSFHSQRYLSAILLRNGDRLDRIREVTARGHLFPDLVQIAFQVRLEVRKRLLIYLGLSHFGLTALKASYTSHLSMTNGFVAPHRHSRLVTSTT